MNFLASTLGRVSPKYRTLGQWAETYRLILAAKPISDKTKINRRSCLSHVLDSLGDRTIGSIRPHEVSAMVLGIYAVRPQTAKRVLIEVRDMLAEAINYGWIDRNPATGVKIPAVRVQRQRLTLDQWWLILRYSIESMPPWVSRLLALALVTGQRRSDLCKMRFADVWDGHLHVEQTKTGARLALPLALCLDAVGLSLGEVLEDCKGYATGNEFLLRKHDGCQLSEASLSARFEIAREASIPVTEHPPSLHECRSLSERLYRAQGINTMTLLGHKHQAMTDVYNDDRGLSKGQWKALEI